MLVAAVDVIERALASSGSLYKILLAPGFENIRWNIGVWRAWRNFHRAYREVPAYRRYIDARGGRPRIRLDEHLLPDLRTIPEVD
jgi:phenylacetate-CoA ligase